MTTTCEWCRASFEPTPCVFCEGLCDGHCIPCLGKCHLYSAQTIIPGAMCWRCSQKAWTRMASTDQVIGGFASWFFDGPIYIVRVEESDGFSDAVALSPLGFARVARGGRALWVRVTTSSNGPPEAIQARWVARLAAR